MTPDTASAEQAIAGVVESLCRARQFLLDPSPRNIDCSRILMAQCAGQLASVIECSRSGGESLRESIGLVRRELGTIASLLASAASYRRGLLNAMRAAAGAEMMVSDNGSEKVQRVHVLC